MSFYGQVLYEFTKLFTKINISNNNNETAVTPASGSQPSLVAADRWDQVDIKGGNRWIQLTSNATDKSITIAHANPGSVDPSKTVIGFKALSQEEQDGLPEGTTITSLSAAQCIETTQSQYDAAGHCVQSEKSYFSLPISDTRQDLTNLEARMDHVETKHITIPSTDTNEYTVDDTNKGITLDSYLSTNGYVSQDTFETQMAEYLNENEYVTTGVTGVLSDMHPTLAEGMTITDVIGLMDNSNNEKEGIVGASGALNRYKDPVKPATTLYSISEILVTLISELTDLKEEVENLGRANNQLLALIDGLDSRLQALEATEEEVEETE